MAEDNPIIAAESGANPTSQLPKLDVPKAPPEQAQPKPLPQANAAALAQQYNIQQQPDKLGEPLNQETLKALQDKLQPPQLQQIQNTDLSQYTGFKPNFPTEQQTPPGADLSQLPPMGNATQLDQSGEQQLQQLQQQKLQGVTNFTQEASKNLSSSILKGSSSVPLYDGQSWDSLNQRINNANRVIESSAAAAKQDMATKMMTPQSMPQVETNPNNFRPDSMQNPFRNGDIGGFVHSLWNRFWSPDNTVDLQGAAKKLLNDQNYNDKDEWAPFRGYRMFADAVYKDPWKMVYAPLAIPIASVENKYGESGRGILGGLQYVAALGTNVVLGGLTDMYNLVTGTKSPPNQAPNFVQAFKGGSYDLLRQPDAKHPLSIYANQPAPDNLAELKQRSILYSNPVSSWAIDRLSDLGVRKFPKPFGQQTADVGLKIGEGAAGLVGDVVADPTHFVSHVLNPKTWTEASKVAQVASKASEETAEVGFPKLGPRIIVGANLPVIPVPTSSEIVKAIPNHLPGQVVNPDNLVEVYRSLQERTALGQASGHVQPGRLMPLPELRMQMMRSESEELNKLYAPYGPPLDQHSLRADIEAHPPLMDVGMPDSLREVIPELRKAQLSLQNKSLPQEVRLQISHTADLLSDKLATAPNVSNPAVMQELQPRLSQKYLVSSPEGLDLLKQKFEHEINYHASALNSSELSGHLAEQQQELVSNLKRIDQTSDVGRDVLHTNPPMPLHEPLEKQPVANPELTDLVNQNNYYHGTKVIGLDLKNTDPILGGSRSELGTAHYLTSDINEAQDAAKATANTNLPPLSSRAFSEQGTVHQVRPSLQNVLDAKMPPPDTAKQAFLDAARHSGLDRETIDAYTKRISGSSDLPLARYFTEFDKLAAQTGHAFPESEVLGFQREASARLREMGYDGIAHSNTAADELYEASPTRKNIYADDKLSMDTTKSDYLGTNGIKAHDVEWTLDNQLTRDHANADSVPVQSLKKMQNAWRDYVKTPESRMLFHAPISSESVEETAMKLRTYLNQGFELTKEGNLMGDNRLGQLANGVSKSPISRSDINELARMIFEGEDPEEILSKYGIPKSVDDYEKVNPDFLAVFDHTKLESNVIADGIGNGSPLEGAATRYNILQRTLDRFPDDDVVKTQTKEAGATLQSRIVQQTAENYQQATQKAVTDAHSLINTERELTRLSESERATEQTNFFKDADAKNQTQSKHLNAPDDGWCS